MATTYCYCLVKTCKNNSNRTPEKIFVPVPRIKSEREFWFRLAKRDMAMFSGKSRLHFCEDHFDLPKEMINFKKYRKYCGMRPTLIPGCYPKFLLPPDDNDFNQLAVQRTSIIRTYNKKSEKSASQQKIHESNKVGNLTPNTTNSLEEDSKCNVVITEPQKKDINKKKNIHQDIVPSLQKPTIDQKPLKNNSITGNTEMELDIETVGSIVKNKHASKCSTDIAGKKKNIQRESTEKKTKNCIVSQHTETVNVKNKTHDAVNAEHTNNKTDISENSKSKTNTRENTRKRTNAKIPQIETAATSRNKIKICAYENTVEIMKVNETVASATAENKSKVSQDKRNIKEKTNVLTSKGSKSIKITSDFKVINGPHLHYLNKSNDGNKINFREHNLNFLNDNNNPLKDDDHLHCAKALSKLYEDSQSSQDSNLSIHIKSEPDDSGLDLKRSCDDTYELNIASEAKRKCKEKNESEPVNIVKKECFDEFTHTESIGDEQMENCSYSLDIVKKECDEEQVKYFCEVEMGTVKKECHNEFTLTANIADEQRENCIESQTAEQVPEYIVVEVLPEDNDDKDITTANNDEVKINTTIKLEPEFCDDKSCEKSIDLKEITFLLRRTMEPLEPINSLNDDELRAILPPDLHTINWQTDSEEHGTIENFVFDESTILFKNIKPIDIFLQIWDTEIMLEMIKLINMGALHIPLTCKYRSKTTSNINELYVLFANTIVPGKRFIKQECRFRDLKNFLGYALMTKPNELQNITRLLSQRFQDLYHPKRYLCVDKSMIDCEAVVDDITSKTTAYTLCDSKTGYILNIVTESEYEYTKKPQEACTKPTRLSPAKVVLELTSPFFHKCHAIVLDPNFCSPLLARYLKSNKTDCLGSLREIPESIELSELQSGQVLAASCEDLEMLVWKNEEILSHPVCMISTYLDFEKENNDGNQVVVPHMIQMYEHLWAGVDLKNQRLSLFPLDSCHNPINNKLFIWLLNISVMNAYIIFKQNHDGKYISYNDFQSRLAIQLKKFTRSDVNDSVVDDHLRPIILGNHYLVKNGSPPSLEMCEYCQLLNKHANTTWQCESCSVPLCLDCMKPYHTTDRILRKHPCLVTKAFKDFMQRFGRRKEQIYKLYT